MQYTEAPFTEKELKTIRKSDGTNESAKRKKLRPSNAIEARSFDSQDLVDNSSRIKIIRVSTNSKRSELIT